MPSILVIVDPQNDFAISEGSLYVQTGEIVIARINRFIRRYGPRYHTIFLSRDWHPKNHTSFASIHRVAPFTLVDGEMKWPDHCVRDTWGAASALDEWSMGQVNYVIYKGTNPDVEEYSAMVARSDTGRTIQEYLSCSKPSNLMVDIIGLAYDYCVKATALDAVKVGFLTRVILPLTAAVAPETERLATKEMEAQRIQLVLAEDLKK